MPVTPGVKFLTVALVLPVSSLALVTVALQHLSNQLGYDVPAWAFVVSAILSAPLYTTVRTVSKQWRHQREARALGARLPPQAPGKWFGNLDILQGQIEAVKNGYPGDGLAELCAELGPVVNMRVLWSNLILTTQPEHIKLILATDFPNYVKGPEFDFNMSSVLGSGVFNSDGDMWKFHRNLTRPHFNREKITDFDLFDRHANEAIALMKERAAADCAFDVQDLLHRFTLDTATEFLLGTCVHSLRAGLPYPHGVVPRHEAQKKLEAPAAHDTIFRASVDPDEFATAFQQAQYAIATRERKGWIWPLWEIFHDATIEPMKVVNAFIEPLVREAVAKHQAASESKGSALENEDDGGCLLDHLVKTTSDPKILKDETLNILVAGRDTTASTLTFVMHFLAMYPEVTKRLREEVLGKMGTTRRPTFDDIKEMKYLRAVINETLRLYPVVPFNVRTAIEARVWPSPDPTQKPIYVPALTKTPYSVFLMHRREDLFGADAQEFDPDRWLDDRLKQFLLKDHFAFLPFNAGPRICLGQQFAYNEMSLMLIKIMQNFSSFQFDRDSTPVEALPPSSWSSTPGRKGIDQLYPKMHLTMYTAGGLWIKAKDSPK